tara:strand:- start:1144 stop:2070 length:927 start_codon:yes stop_codon:yes gene_type:complete
MSSETWKAEVTERSGASLVRRKQARHTNASDASSWPTASARDHKGGYTGGRIRNGKVSMDTLDVAVQAHTDGGILSNWATPQASDHVEGARTAKESNQKCLGRDLNQMSNWPTPRAGNPGSRKPGTGGKILAEEAKKNWGTPASNDANKTPHCEINSKQGGLSKSVGIEEAKKNWRTPSVAEVQNQCNSTQIYLQNQVGATKKKGKNWEKHNGPPAPEKSSTSGKNHGSWPTARSSDAEGGRIKTEKTEKGFRSKREKSDQYFGAKLRDAAEMEKPPTMKLNPNWVEQLMGLEVGWTQLPTEWIDSDS